MPTGNSNCGNVCRLVQSRQADWKFSPTGAEICGKDCKSEQFCQAESKLAPDGKLISGNSIISGLNLQAYSKFVPEDTSMRGNLFSPISAQTYERSSTPAKDLAGPAPLCSNLAISASMVGPNVWFG